MTEDQEPNVDEEVTIDVSPALAQAYAENRQPTSEEMAEYVKTLHPLAQAQYHYQLLQQELGVIVDPEIPITDLVTRVQLLMEMVLEDDAAKMAFELRVMDVKIANLEGMRERIMEQKDEMARMEREAVLLNGHTDGGGLNREQRRAAAKKKGIREL